MLKLEWKQLPFQYIYDRLLYGEYDSDNTLTYKGLPNSLFLDKRYDTVPMAYTPLPFEVTTSDPDQLYKITIQSRNPSLQLRPKRIFDVFIEKEKQDIFLELDEGHNFIVIENKITKETASTIINARRYATFLYSFSKEMYNNVQVKLDDIEQDIFNKYATRLAEPLFTKLYPLMPSVESLQVLSFRLLTKAFTSKSSTEIGVSETGSGITLNTPHFSKFDKNTEEIDPIRYPAETYQEFFNGKLAHIWVPSFTLIRWKTFQTFIHNIQGSSLLDIDENEIIIKNTYDELERHIFDAENETDFFEFRRYKPDIVIRSHSNLDVCLIQPGYPLDLFVTEFQPLGDCRTTLDMAIQLDTDCHFDSEEYDDQHDGYIGMSLVDRMERAPGQLGFDSTRCPDDDSLIDKLVYKDGYYCKLVEINNEKLPVDVNENYSASATMCILDIDGGPFVQLEEWADLDGGTFALPTDVCFDGGVFPLDGNTFIAPMANADAGTFAAPTTYCYDGLYFIRRCPPNCECGTLEDCKCNGEYTPCDD